MRFLSILLIFLYLFAFGCALPQPDHDAVWELLPGYKISAAEPGTVFIPCDPSRLPEDFNESKVRLLGSLLYYSVGLAKVQDDGVELTLQTPNKPAYEPLTSSQNTEGSIVIGSQDYTVEAQCELTYPDVTVSPSSLVMFEPLESREFTLTAQNDTFNTELVTEKSVVLNGSLQGLELENFSVDSSIIKFTLSGKPFSGGIGSIRLKNNALTSGYGAEVKITTQYPASVNCPTLFSGSGTVTLMLSGDKFLYMEPDIIELKGALAGATVESVSLKNSWTAEVRISGGPTSGEASINVIGDALLEGISLECPVTLGTPSTQPVVDIADGSDEPFIEGNANDILAGYAARPLGERITDAFVAAYHGPEPNDAEVLADELMNTYKQVKKFKKSKVFSAFSGTVFESKLFGLETELEKILHELDQFGMEIPDASQRLAALSDIADALPSQMRPVLENYYAMEHQMQDYLETMYRLTAGMQIALAMRGYLDAQALGDRIEKQAVEWGLDRGERGKYVQTKEEATTPSNLDGVGECYIVVSNGDKRMYAFKKTPMLMKFELFTNREPGVFVTYEKRLYPAGTTTHNGIEMGLIHSYDMIQPLMERAKTNNLFDLLSHTKISTKTQYIFLDGFDLSENKLQYELNSRIVRDVLQVMLDAKTMEPYSYKISELFPGKPYLGEDVNNERINRRKAHEKEKFTLVYVQL